MKIAHMAGIALAAMSSLWVASPLDAADGYFYRYKGTGPTPPPPPPDVTIALNGYTFPKQRIGQPFNGGSPFNFSNLVQANVVPSGPDPDAGLPVSWSFGSPSDVPTDLVLDLSAATLQGTPSEVGTFQFELIATRNGDEGRRIYTIEVGGAVLEVIQIESGAIHTCAVTTTNGVKCWGSNQFKQLGNNPASSSTVPVDVPGLETGVTLIAVQNYHNCAVHNGALKCWGNNDLGQITGTAGGTVAVPHAVAGLGSGVTAISGGNYHTCAVQNGGAYCWGYNYNNRLGFAGQQNTPWPVQNMASGVTAISSTEAHTCAIKDGGAWCWGYNQMGQVGNGTTVVDVTSPAQVNGLGSGVTSIAAGTYHTCAVHNGAAKCWGWNEYGQLGKGDVDNAYYTQPQDVSGLASGVSMISADYRHSCAVHNGAAKCWGEAAAGKLGTGASAGGDGIPKTVTGLETGVASVSAGQNQTCARQSAGEAMCWGFNYYGQLGTGDTTDKPSATDVRPN